MSSGIRSSYNRQTKVMTVWFRNGTYQLPNVPRSVADSFKASASKGNYWNHFLKGKY